MANLLKPFIIQFSSKIDNAKCDEIIKLAKEFISELEEC